MGTSCKKPICCRNESGKAEPGAGAGKFGHLGSCDIPWVTVESFIDYAANQIKPDFIIYLGDSPAHDSWQQEKDDHLKEVEQISKVLQEKYKGPVYPLLGNHEGYPYDQFDTEDPETHRWLVEGTLKAWDPWFTQEMKKTFKQNGCYSALFNDTKLRIIGLTPFAQLNTNRYAWGNQTDNFGVVFFDLL